MADSNLILVPASFQFIPNNLQNKGGQAVSGLSRGQFATCYREGKMARSLNLYHNEPAVKIVKKIVAGGRK
jgi:hypothetical protein